MAEAVVPLTGAERQFYARQLSIRDFGEAGQQALKQARVLVVGAGGLGCPILQYLAAAGVGTLGIVDHDTVSVSNLQRQILFLHEDCGQPKARVARDRLARLNPHIRIVAHETRLDQHNAMELVGQYDVIVDGTDNFTSKFLINDACWFAGKPLVFGSIFQYEGQVSVFNAADGDQRGPNYRDLLPGAPPPELAPNCAEAGVIGIVPGIIGCLQANEVLKLVTGMGATLSGKLLTFDALDCSTSILALRKSAHNPLRGEPPLIGAPRAELRAESPGCALGGPAVATVSVARLRELCAGGSTRLIDVREADERVRYSIGGLHVPLAQLGKDGDAAAVLAPPVDTVVFYCESGARSAAAARALLYAGNVKLYSLEGGLRRAIDDGCDLASLAQELAA